MKNLFLTILFVFTGVVIGSAVVPNPLNLDGVNTRIFEYCAEEGEWTNTTTINDGIDCDEYWHNGALVEVRCP